MNSHDLLKPHDLECHFPPDTHLLWNQVFLLTLDLAAGFSCDTHKMLNAVSLLKTTWSGKPFLSWYPLDLVLRLSPDTHMIWNTVFLLISISVSRFPSDNHVITIDPRFPPDTHIGTPFSYCTNWKLNSADGIHHPLGIPVFTGICNRPQLLKWYIFFPPEEVHPKPLPSDDNARLLPI